MLETNQDIIAWGLLVLPLMVIAWACVSFVLIEVERNRHERYKRFHMIMEQLGRSDGATADKMAAAYELRRYPEYSDVLQKVFVDGKVRHDTSEAVQKQIKDTLNHFIK